MKLEKLKGSGNQVSIKSEIVAQQASKTRKDLKTQKDPLIRFWILLYSTLLYSTLDSTLLLLFPLIVSE